MDGAVLMPAPRLGPIARKKSRYEAADDWFKENVSGPIVNAGSWFHDEVADPINKGIEYYAGPHASQSLGNIAQAADMASYWAPGVGDAKDTVESNFRLMEDIKSGAGWPQITMDAINYGLAVMPMVASTAGLAKMGDMVDAGNNARAAGAVADAGKVKKKASAIGKIAKGGKKVAQSSDELLEQALATPRKMIKGKYIGAPEGIGTPQAEQALVDKMANMATSEAGEKGIGFYEGSQDMIRRHTDDPKIARAYVSASGHTSPNTPPLSNTNYAIRGMHQQELGYPVKTGQFPNNMGPRVERDIIADTLSKDPKTGQYSLHLLPPEMRPDNYAEYSAFPGRIDRPVHDVWDLRAKGYDTNTTLTGASPQQHVFMDRIDKKAIHKLNRDPESLRRFGPRAWNEETLQEAIWNKARTDDGFSQTASWDDMIEANKGFTQMAAIPGPSTGVPEQLLNAPLEVKRKYTDAMFGAIASPKGGNAPARALGLSAEPVEGFGPWQGMMEPNRKIDMGIGTIGSGQNKVMDPASTEAQSLMRDWNQLLLGQEGAGFTAPRGGSTIDASNLASVQGVSLKTPDDYQKAFTAVEESFGPGWADSVVVQPDARGNLMVKNISGIPNKEFQSTVKDLHKRMGGTGLERMRDVGNDFTYVQFNDPSYRGLLDRTLANPKAKAIFDQKIQPLFRKAQDTHQAFMGSMGLDTNTVLDRFRTIVADAGENWPAAIEDAVKKGIIPAFAAPVIYDMVSSQFGTEEGVQ
jgi:hypothetical protein